MTARPLFIALKTAYYDAFADGTKHDELRVYGPRWNEQTCAIGRPVTLSKGYGKKNRLSGKVVAFKRYHASNFTTTAARDAIIACYGTLNVMIACIGIEVDTSP